MCCVVNVKTDRCRLWPPESNRGAVRIIINAGQCDAEVTEVIIRELVETAPTGFVMLSNNFRIQQTWLNVNDAYKTSTCCPKTQS